METRDSLYFFPEHLDSIAFQLFSQPDKAVVMNLELSCRREGALSPGGKMQFSRESLVSRKRLRRVPSQTFTGFYLISYSEHVLVCQQFCYGWTADKKLFWAIHRVILGFSPLSAVESQLGNLQWRQWVWTLSHVQSSYLDSHEPNNSNQPWKIKGWDRIKEMVETQIEWVYLYKKK